MITESTLTIATVDIAIFALIALSGIISVVRGFIKETMSIVIWLSAFFIAVSFKSVISDYLIKLDIVMIDVGIENQFKFIIENRFIFLYS